MTRYRICVVLSCAYLQINEKWREAEKTKRTKKKKYKRIELHTISSCVLCVFLWVFGLVSFPVNAMLYRKTNWMHVIMTYRMEWMANYYCSCGPETFILDFFIYLFENLKIFFVSTEISMNWQFHIRFFRQSFWQMFE